MFIREENHGKLGGHERKIRQLEEP